MPKKALVVDNDFLFVEFLSVLLEKRGYDVTKAYDGQEAVDAARTAKFDLALLDLKMPGMDGKQVLEILKREHKHLEIIILTGHGSLDSAVECTKLGAYGYLPKPYELDKLLEALREAYQARLTKKFDADQARMERIRR